VPDDFERMYEQTRGQVLRYCLRRTSVDAAVDVVADVYAVAWRRRDSIPPDPLPWLYGVARRVLGNQRRSARRWSSLKAKAMGAGAGPEGPEAHVLRDAEHRLVAEAVSRLSSRDSEIIRLAAWEGLDRDQIAVALGASPNAVTQRLSRALDRLARELGAARISGNRFFQRRSA
jgi:RNA polymerase sigma-70 factor (ECF subfamily)